MLEDERSVDSGERMHTLDGLRAVAASMVFFHHLAANGIADRMKATGHGLAAFVVDSGSASGVELFFVLSGAVLLRPYVRYGRRFDTAEYLRRRAQRLYPPFVVAWLLSGLSVFVVSAFPTWWTPISGLPRFDVGTWLAQLGILYFGTSRYNFAWWSLGVELLFYVAVPFIVAVVARIQGTTRAGLGVLGGAVLVALVASWLLPASLSDDRNPLSSLAEYSSCFAAGVVLSRIDLPRGVARALAGLGVVFVASAALGVLPATHVGYGLLYTGIVSRSLARDSSLRKWLSRWQLVWLGERSYSLFLVHCAVMTLVNHWGSIAFATRGTAYVVVTRALSIPASLLVAMVVFDRVERPFARGLVTAGEFWPPVSERARRTLDESGIGSVRQSGSRIARDSAA